MEDRCVCCNAVIPEGVQVCHVCENNMIIGGLQVSVEDRELRRNASGCSDPTAYRAIKNIDKEDEKFRKLLHTIFYICDNAGFHIEGRIVLVDDETGRVWR